MPRTDSRSASASSPSGEPCTAGCHAKHLEGFGPKVDGFDQVPFDDLQELEAAIRPETAALMIEPI